MATQYNHILIILFRLEAIILITIILLPIISCFLQLYTHSSILVLLTIRACEARLGLRLIVYISRTFGSDNISITTINKC